LEPKGEIVTADLSTDLQSLKREAAEMGSSPTLLSQAVLRQHFHGLTLGQIIKLTDVPVLGVIDQVVGPDGTRIDRFSIDGRDRGLCHSVARQLLLDPAIDLRPDDVREVQTCDDDVVRETMVRDHNDIVYQVTDREAVVNESLTGTLATLRQRGAYLAQNPGMTVPPAPEGESPGAMAETAAHVLRELVELRSCNAVARLAVVQLVRSTGERELLAALAAADPAVLRTTFDRILSASDEIEAQLDGLTAQVSALMRAIREVRMPNDLPQEAPDPKHVDKPQHMGELRTPY
jgi:hypothetical protein